MMTKTTRVARSPWRLLSFASTLPIVLLLYGGMAFGASLSVSSTQVQEAGDTARVCVGLSSGGENIAATQNDLVWDAACASVVGNCEANSGHGKQLMSNQKGPGALRAIIISLQDTNTIPDGELYCCTFRAELGSGGSCCAIGVQGVSASDPEGKALGLAGRGGQICLASRSGSGGGLEGGRRQPQDVVGADLGSGAQQQAPAAGQPAGQQAAPQAAGSGNAVASGGTGGVQGGVGGVPGGIGGVPGGQPGAPVQPGQAQPGQIAQQQAVEPGTAPAAGSDAARPQAPVAGAPQQQAAAEGTPTRAPAAAAARPTSAPAAAAPREVAPVAKPGATAPGSTTSKAAAPAPAPKASGCSCEIAPSGVGFEGSGALVAIGLLLWARRRRI